MKKTVKIQGKSEITAIGKHGNGNAKPVFCIDTGEVFASVTDAAEAAGANTTTMTWCCTKRQNTCKGKRYCFVSDVSEHISEMAELIRKANEYDKIMEQKNAVKKAEEEEAKRKAQVEKRKKQIEDMRAQLAKEEAEYDQAVINLNLLTNANNAFCMA